MTCVSTAYGEEHPALRYRHGNNIINLPDYIYYIYHVFALGALNGQGPRPSIL